MSDRAAIGSIRALTRSSQAEKGAKRAIAISMTGEERA